MGLTSSKHNAHKPSTSSSAGRRRTRFQPPCLGFDDSDDDRQKADYQSEENCCSSSSGNQIILDGELKDKYCAKVKSDKSDEIVYRSPLTEINGRSQPNLSDTTSRASSSSRALSPSDRKLFSRCSFFPGNSSFRISRAPNTELTRNIPASSRNFSASNEKDSNLGKGPARSSIIKTKSSRFRDFLPSCLINGFPSLQHEDHALSYLDSNSPASTENVLMDGNNNNHNNREECNVNLQTSANSIDTENMELRNIDRRNGGMERNVQFSRTLSVGRLRDRVLRRTYFPESTFSPLQQDRDVTETGEGNGAGILATNGSPLVPSNYFNQQSGISSSSYNSLDCEVETSHAQANRYHDLLENRSNFLERRRRIRSQVRALQRLGSRFENLSGHERSCIISGQHQNGHCTCCINSQNSNSNDDTGARQSISRIVMLAEALFEVLDEIHQQSMVLSSRASVSSIGSIPAPSEVVESLPVRLYSKPQKHLTEDAAQCYICLVEYEEGDNVRTLPCHHEFHGTCVDKWLKEIHRVCPLCRGNVCTTESLPSEN